LFFENESILGTKKETRWGLGGVRLSNYKGAFDAHLAEANSAITNNHTALVASLPGMHPAHLERLFHNISNMLSKIDKNEAKHPEFLAGNPPYPVLAAQLLASVKSGIEAGIDNFIQNILPQIVDVEQRLIHAVGIGAYNVQDIKNAQVRSLNQIVHRAESDQRTIRSISTNSSKEREEIKGVAEQIRALLLEAGSDKKKVEDIKILAEKLARGNASQNPLEKTVREARDKFDELASILDKSSKGADRIEQAAKETVNNKDESDKQLISLKKTNEEANAILRNATQAGLAGAYKMERDRLSKEQSRYAIAFYSGVLLIILYAAIFIVPIFSHILDRGGDTQSKVGESALLLLVRIAILAPAVWALIFTNKRHANLETLQMDYAAKAATALAYSGYRDEMEQDVQLANKLKNGLVIRFLEHPERLLHRNTIKEQIGFGKDGLSYTSTATPPNEPVIPRTEEE